VTFALLVVGLFLLVAASEMLNGIARTLFLNKRVGVANAKRLSLLPALALCLTLCYFYVPFLSIRTDGGLLLLGASLSLFMGLFDVAVGRFIVKARWEAILGDFDIRKGNLLGIGLVAIAFCPLLAMRIARLLGGGPSASVSATPWGAALARAAHSCYYERTQVAGSRESNRERRT